MADGERAALLGAAWTVLGRSSFEGFKVQLVMREAGVSARAFYRQFADKDELLLALLQDEMSRAGALIRSKLAQSMEPAEQVEAWIRSIIEAAADPRRVARARLFSSQQALIREYPAELESSVQLLTDPLREAIARGVESGSFPWAAPDRDAELVYWLAGGSMTDALAAGSEVDVDDLVTNATGFAFRAFGVAPTTPGSSK